MQSNKIEKLINSRYIIEKLTLKRNPSDYQAYIETFRESVIDTNPHQIESCIYALEKLENGGCILADEVGLGKTIEAGLVISQYRSKRKWSILIITPTSLMSQWQNQLKDLFNLSSIIINSQYISRYKKENNDKDLINIFTDNSIYIIGREFASNLEKKKLLSIKIWDLIIVDEAHEIFANIYHRFNSKDGKYNPASKENRIAGNLYYLFLNTPLLLLTATPIQNHILELWGLASYLSPKNYLGELHHFINLFLGGKRSELQINQADELRERISNFLIRNLRKDAELFMDYKFTNRICETLGFSMTPEEKQLYNDVSNYFERDDIYAYSLKGLIELKNEKIGVTKNLLKMTFRRLLGSSFSALANGLKKIVIRLEKMKFGATLPEISEISEDIEEIEDNIDFQDDTDLRIDKDILEEDIIKINAEIELLKDFVSRAESLSVTSKDEIILKTIKEKIFSDEEKFFQKVVIFTQSVSSLYHLKHFFEDNGFKDDIVLFSGSNKSKEADEALQYWDEEEGSTYSEKTKPVGEAAIRQALVYYFRKKKRIFISTEAGAKGLNLQFCNVIINYDLPWNPQRIEQRIGRCHRYKQSKDVLVINCINGDNETEKRIYEILYNKFNLFKGTLDSSNEILGILSSAINFETRINEILNEFKTEEERKIMLDKFQEELDDATKELINEKHKKTRNLINNLDSNVKNRLSRIRETMPAFFSEYDNDMILFLENYCFLNNMNISHHKSEDSVIIEIDNDKKFYIGKKSESVYHHENINLNHNFVQKAIDDIKSKSELYKKSALINYSGSSNKSEILKNYLNKTGNFTLIKAGFFGLEEEEKLYKIISIVDDNNIIFLNDEEIFAFDKLDILDCNEDKEIIDTEKNNNEKEQYLLKLIKDESIKIQNQQQPRINKKLHNMRIELTDTENFLKNQETELIDEIYILERKINETFNNDEGKKLLKDRMVKQTKLSNIREELLKFQNDFDKRFRIEEQKMLEKRFLDTKIEPIFSLNFKII